MESPHLSNSGRSRCATSLRAIAAIACLTLLPAVARAQDNALPFTRSYLLTGNYAVVGVDLLPQASDCTTFSPDCYAKGNISVTTCPTSGPVAPGSCIPEGADVLAAFMYWEAIATDPSAVPKARLKVDGQPYTTLTKARRSDVALPSQGSCLSSSGNPLTLSMFSADVLRFFPFERDSAGQSTGKRKVTGTHGVALAEVGNGNNAKQGAGASLFFLYRLPSEPLRKVVVYDGAYLQYPAGAVMRQQLQGFYQSWGGHQSAWLTHIVGSGAKNTTERLLFNDAPVATDVFTTDPFAFPLGDSGGNASDRAWANPTFDVSSKMPQTTPNLLTGFGETASTAVDHVSSSPYECLSWAAVIFSVAVKDADGDGLPDGLEDATAGLKEPNPADLVNTVNPVGRDLPNLNQMGASSSQPDVFIEMNGMWAPGGTKYGDDVNSPSKAPFSTILGINAVTISNRHDHLPTPEMIRLLGEAFEIAPTPIRLHADVGNVNAYKSLAGFNSSQADKYLVCQHDAVTKACTGASLQARGGELIKETPCDGSLQTTDPTQPNSLGCHFSYFPGTIGWKFGLEHYRDQAVDANDGQVYAADPLTLTAAQEDQCYLTGGYTDVNGVHPCKRRFDPIRTGLFHYFLYAHALGIPKGKPCLDVSDPNDKKDADYNGTDGSGRGICVGLQNNPNFNVPRSTSGAGDAPGGNGLITLGLWDQLNGVGSAFIVASTTLHEFGHNLDLSHGGAPPNWGNASRATTFEPNCKPNYPSIMSYLFQINGLMDLNGNARIDYSRGTYGDTGNLDATTLDEAHLHDGFLLLPDATLNAAVRYRAAWFVPVIAPTFQNGVQVTPGNLAYTLGVQPASRYCTGVKFTGVSTMGRIDGPGLSATPTTTSLIDWNLDPSSAPTQDVNFDGVTNAPYRGYNDWTSIRLNQISAGKHAAGFSLGQGGFEFGQGGFDFGQGGFEFGQGGFDFGQGGFEFGQGGFDFGQGGFDFGQGGFDFGDGAFNFGQGGFEFGQGGFEFGQGGFDYGQGGFDFGNDIDFDLVKKNGLTPPVAVAASVIQTAGSTLHRVSVTWSAPNVGTVLRYQIYRALGATINGQSTVEQLCSVAGVPSGMPACTSATSFIDGEELPYNQKFTYFVRAVFSNCNGAIERCESGPSNFATVDTVNDAPVAVNDPPAGQEFRTFLTTPITIAASTLLKNDTDTDTAINATTRLPLRVAVITVLPTQGQLVLNADGSVTYTPNGDGTFTFKYKADDGFWRGGAIPMSDKSNEATVTIIVDKKKK